MNIYIGADHRGAKIKSEIINYLKSNGLNVYEIAIKNHDTDDFPDFAFALGEKIIENEGLGILICGDGIGMSIAANKVKGIRAARVLTVNDAFNAKNHNDVNVITLGVIEIEEAFNIIDTFIATKRPTEEKYLRRVEKIKLYEAQDGL